MKNFQMKTGKLEKKYVYINESYVGIDYVKWSSVPR